jgi:putative CocE/NonD family hydrolase
MIGPWVHASYEGYAGEVDFGVRASDSILYLEEHKLRWYDYWLRGIENGIADEAPIHIFVMGENRWRCENEWPLARADRTPYYLHSGGAANSLHGDGGLSPEAPVEEPVDTFLYDPRNPVPTRGGGLCCWRAALPPGAFDQREVEARPDVLCYTTPPLEQDVEVTGPVEVHLWATTSAPDTDFTAKLVDVSPCGYARNIQDGIIRACYHRAGEQATPNRQGGISEYVIDLSGTSNVVKGGHRIRLEISSSNFPRFSCNPNTGRPLGENVGARTALQTILHDGAHPSHILLPIISQDQG